MTEPAVQRELELPPLEPGTQIGHYEVVRFVGRGGFGVIYEVARSGRRYALKFSRYRLGALDDEDRKYREERINRELASLRTLRHPNIVRIHADDQWPEPEDGFPYLVMDLVDGLRLNDWSRRAAPSFNQICVTFEKIARAVDYMHQRDIFHRDLKSQNIIVRTSDGEPIIVDFGVSRPQAALTVTREQTMLGTVTHLTPEFVAHLDSVEFGRGKPFQWKPTTDLHSIGFLLYEVLAGRPPFPLARGVGGEMEVLRRIKSERPAAPSTHSEFGVPASLDAITLKLLEKDPDHRYQSGRELAEALALARQAGDASWDVPRGSQAVPVAARPDGPQESVEKKAAPGDARDGDKAELLPVFQDASPATGGLAPEPPREEGAFRPPTVDGPRFEPVDVDERPDDPSTETAAVPKEIQMGQELLARSERKRKPPYLILGGLGVLALLALFLVFAATRGERPAKPENLLAAEREQEKRELDAAASSSRSSYPAPVTEPGTLPPPLEGDASRDGGHHPAAVGAVPVPAPLAVRPSRRAKLPAKGSPPPADVAPKPAAPEEEPLLRSALADAAQDPKASRGVPMGTRIAARLVTNLDSRTIADGPVEAVLPTPSVRHGDVLLPARTILFGRATTSSSNGRFTVHFNRMRLPDDTELDFSGIAFDRADGKPGLAAARRIEAAAPQGESLAGRIAKGTGNALLATVSGGVVQDVARTAGEVAVNSERPSSGSSGNSVILLDGGGLIDVWVEKSF